MPWDCHDPDAVRHNNVRAFSGNDKAGFFEGPDRAQVRYSGYLRHTLCRNFYFPQVAFPGQIFRHFQVIADGVPNIRQGFLLGGAL